jgi:hypothetical protein
MVVIQVCCSTQGLIKVRFSKPRLVSSQLNGSYNMSTLIYLRLGTFAITIPNATIESLRALEHIRRMHQ